MELAGGLNNQAKAGCPGAGEEVAQGGTEGARTALRAPQLNPPPVHGTHRECLKHILLLITADDTLDLS